MKLVPSSKPQLNTSTLLPSLPGVPALAGRGLTKNKLGPAKAGTPYERGRWLFGLQLKPWPRCFGANCGRALVLSLLVIGCARSAADDLESGFRNPPPSARPWVYWFPLDGNISSNGITLDLEAMKRVGIGGVLYMETDQGAPKGPARFAGPLWRDLFKHICAEANRLGLEVNMNNDAGWCGSGGPWITPELSMQKVVWAETNLAGPGPFDGVLAQPPAVHHFYRDIAVFAFPTASGSYRITQLAGKTAETTQEIPLRAAFATLPAQETVARDKILDLTSRLHSDAHLQWEVPAGQWTLLRLGHTTTGKDNHPAPVDGRGLECDKLSREAADAAFAGLMGKVIADSKPLVGERKTLVSTHIDSWEVGSQNWTPKFRDEFRRLRGYDPLLLLPVMAGHAVDSVEISERFLWDVRMTVNDLLVENYAGRFQELARRHGIRLSIEAYGEPADDLTYAGRADEPMAEFWSWNKFDAAASCTEMASAAHVYGKRILGAEAFTATDAEKWQGHPAMIKDLGDWAFCEGINRFVFHRYALQPWTDVRPGMSMGPWGLHYERTQTWWEQSRAWHEYLARCQFLLQQGRFVADLCFLAPEMSPQQFKSPVKSGHDRPGYNFDGCSPEVVRTRMSVKDGRLLLPDGTSYRLLVLPQVPAMTPTLLRKIKELVAAGATVVGAPPAKSPSLSGYPHCDEEVKSLANELWGTGEPPAELTQRLHGKGRLFWGGDIRPKPAPASEPRAQFGSAKWIWHNEGNPAASAPAGTRHFRQVVVVDPGRAVSSARLILTADNTFECWINAQPVGSGDNWARPYAFDVKPLLKPGSNLIAVTAVNTTTAPNPAGLVGLLTIEYAGGQTVEVPTDTRWQSAETVPANWRSDLQSGANWAAALELGPVGIAPWGDIQAAPAAADPIPDITIVERLMERLGVPPDFAARTEPSAGAFRYTHRQIDGADLYFVANKNPHPEEAVCSFRIAGRRPEFWWPETGRIERPAVYDQTESLTRVPLRLEPYGSVFVLFRQDRPIEPDRIVGVERNGTPLMGTDLQTQSGSSGGERSPSQPSAWVTLSRNSGGEVQGLFARSGQYALRTADGRTRMVEVPALPDPVELSGPWQLRFPPHWGAPEQVTLERLISWSEHADPGVRFFSGTATYQKSFELAAGLLGTNRQLLLDLGRVAVMAEVKLNGHSLGILWKPPFQVDVSDWVRPGENALEVRVVNLWINRQIGDEQLPEDSDRNPDGTLKAWPKWLEEGRLSPTGRYTFTSWRLWKKSDRLVESGLLGPVSIQLFHRSRTPLY